MDRKAQWMIIPRPFPPPTIAFVDSRAPRTRTRRTRKRWRALRRWSARFHLAPWRTLACYALASAVAFALAWLVVGAVR